MKTNKKNLVVAIVVSALIIGAFASFLPFKFILGAGLVFGLSYFLKKHIPDLKKKFSLKEEMKIVSCLNLSGKSRIILVKVREEEILIGESVNGLTVLKEFKTTKEKNKKKEKELGFFENSKDFFGSRYAGIAGFAALFFLFSSGCFAAESVNLASMPNSSFIQIFTAVSVLAISPAIILMMTPFTRIAITLSVLRHAIGLNNVPSNQIVAGLSVILTFFIMQHEMGEIKTLALDPYMKGNIKTEEFLKRSGNVMRGFMYKHVKKADLQNFVSMAKIENSSEIPFSVLVPAFVTSELKTAFQIGVLIFVPFIILDLIVSSVLMSMGMIMIPPTMVSLPLKMLIFVLADGWNLVIAGLYRSFIQ
ncbi:MAG: flagellar type III secretion system pore protein FliP [Elusimicrobiota bacterium]